MPSRIEDYALVGDCETAALVGLDGSVDWLCLPRFDSEACFAALLGTPENGRWQIAPESVFSGGAARTTRRYRGSTLILETTFETADGAVMLVDFMPPRDETIEMVRLVVGLRGSVAVRSELAVRFGYGAVVPWVTSPEAGVLRAVAGPDMVVLRSPVEHHGEAMRSVGTVTVREGERVPFVLSYGPSYRALPPPIDAERALADAEGFWTEWAASARMPEAHQPGRELPADLRDAVVRSLVTLKALTYAPTGGIVAAPTTSLPETLGGIRNWDYRFCWLRDATLTLLCLMNAGYFDEAVAWRNWLLRAVAGDPAKAQIMYGIAGERRLTEYELDWLPGYEGSKPVRIGNGAAGQLQLDVFGEVVDALYQGRRGGLPDDTEAWALQRALLGALESTWEQPDRGIWESRGPPRHYTYSKVMAWVAFDRAVRSVEELGLEGPVERWRELRDRIHADVCDKAWNAELGSFVVAYGSDKLDASLLLIPGTGFLPPEDPRLHGTLKAIESRLIVGGYVMRHDPAEKETGLHLGEGAFLACSFWLADAYAMLGRREEARDLLGRLMALRNDLGLLAEEYDVDKKRQVGNFPQAFSHIALLNTISNLAHGEAAAGETQGQTPLEQRSQNTRLDEPSAGADRQGIEEPAVTA